MVTITAGYELTITARGGEIVGEINLEGYNLDRSMARSSLASDIQQFVEDDMAEHETSK